MIPKEKVDEIIQKTDMVELVTQEGINLERVGKNYKGLCPFHNDSNPSFYVNNEKKIAYCMTCKQGGNPITFLRLKRNITYEEALLVVAEKANIHLDIKINSEFNQKYLEYTKIMQNAQSFYEYYLNNTVNGKKALEYLNKRRLSIETIKSFHIGLAPQKGDILFKTLSQDGNQEIKMLEMGLIKEDGSSYLDVYQNRIMFPIHNEQNQTIGFSGRIYEGESTSKYMNSPETPIFHKGDVLYNLGNAREAIRIAKRVVLFEGFMDVIASWNSGCKESICSMGTSLTENQARLIHRYTEHVVICYDGDNAGIEATYKAIHLLKKQGLQVSIVSLPEGLDPDEFAGKYGNQALKDALNQVKDEYSFYYYYLKRNVDYNSFQSIEEFKEQFFSFLKEANSMVLKEAFLKKMSVDLNVSYESLTIDYSTYCNKNGKAKVVERNGLNKKIPIKVDNKYQMSEKILIKYMTLAPEKAFRIEAMLDDLEYPAIDYRSLAMRQVIIDYFSTYNHFDETSFKELLSNELLVYYEQMDSILLSGMDQEINDSLACLKEYQVLIEIECLKQDLKRAENENEKIDLASKLAKLYAFIKK